MNYLLLLIGLLLTGFGVYQIRKSLQLAKRGIKMEADVINVIRREHTTTEEDGSTSTSDSYYPVFKFSFNEKDYTVESSFGVGSKRKYKVGNKVKIVFMEDKPEKARIQNFGNNWLMPVVLIAVGIMLMVLAFTQGS